MKRLLVLTLLAAPPAAAQTVQIAPSSAEQLEGVLGTLAEKHPAKRWCTEDCVVFLRLQVTGALSSGELTFSFAGEVTSSAPAYVALMGADPALDVVETRYDTPWIAPKATDVFWSGSAYSVVLDDGPFRVRGKLRFKAGAPVTLRVPGPVGLVSIDVTDADVVGTGDRRSVSNATYRLTPKVVSNQPEEQQSRLRVKVQRHFALARDKAFSVYISAQGALPGQVIPVPLLDGEAVESWDEQAATLREDGGERHLDWIAPNAKPSLAYSGKWKGASITLEAPTGPWRETWTIACDDPYRCAFEGNAETRPGAKTHVWEPLPGQQLRVTWKELTALAGMHTVAQRVSLVSRPVGRNLQQSMVVNWSSSSGSLVAVALPEEAIVSDFKLGEAAIPVLKDDSGQIRVSLPAGDSQLRAAWEIAGAAGSMLRPPAPHLSSSIGTVWQTVFRPEGSVVLATGGMAGSPRVALWPDLGACLLLALVMLWLCRSVESPLPSTTLWLSSAAGFAIWSPAALLPLILVLALGRWLSRIEGPRHRVRILAELCTWAMLITVALGVSFATLQQALFSADPISVRSFVAPSPDVGWAADALSWASRMAAPGGEATALPSPWVLSVPLLLIRLLWAAWAVALAVLLVRETRLAVIQLRCYWEVAGWSPATAEVKDEA